MFRKYLIALPIMVCTVLFFSFWATLISIFNLRAGLAVFAFGRDLWNEWAEFYE